MPVQLLLLPLQLLLLLLLLLLLRTTTLGAGPSYQAARPAGLKMQHREQQWHVCQLSGSNTACTTAVLNASLEQFCS
jgi:hypothetical protein